MAGALNIERLLDFLECSISLDKFDHPNLHQAEKNIEYSKRKLERILEVRKKECVLLYTDHLEEEKVHLQDKFQHICAAHMKRLLHTPRVSCDVSTLRHSDIIVVMEKDNILDSVCENVGLICENVTVSEEFDFRGERPLGDIQVSLGGQALLLSRPASMVTENIDVTVVGDDVTVTSHDEKNPPRQEKEKEKEKEKELISALTRLVNEYGKQIEVLSTENFSLKTESDTKSRHENKISVNPRYKKTTIMMNPRCSKYIQTFFDVSVNKLPSRRFVMNMFDDVTPITCDKFIQLCNNHTHGDPGYKGSGIKFVYPGLGCVGGELTSMTSQQRGGHVIKKKMTCENYTRAHDCKGLLSMVNHAFLGFTDSVFFITAQAIPWFDGKDVVFGEVTADTFHVVENIMALETDGFKPLKEIVIIDCGVL